jgi:hypothetical protein
VDPCAKPYPDHTYPQSVACHVLFLQRASVADYRPALLAALLAALLVALLVALLMDGT